MIPEEPFDRGLRDWFHAAAERAPDHLLLAVVDQTRAVQPRRRWWHGVAWLRDLPRAGALLAAAAVVVLAAAFGLGRALPGVGTAPATTSPAPPASIDITFFVNHRWAEPGTVVSAGTFRAFGGVEAEGTFGDEIVLEPDVSYTVTRTLQGADGTIVATMSIRSTIEQATSETVSGTFRIVSGTGAYAGISGTGTVRTGIGPRVDTWPTGTFPEPWQGKIEGGTR
jgi:hypothetical protein